MRRMIAFAESITPEKGRIQELHAIERTRILIWTLTNVTSIHLFLLGDVQISELVNHGKH